MHNKILEKQLIMKRLSIILLICTVLILLFNLLFFWTNSIADSYFYWAFGEYIKTLSYPFIHPFIYARPTTISPPLYSLLLLALEPLYNPSFLLRIVQTSILSTTGYLTFLILKKSFSRYSAILISCISTLLPANIIYANYVMTEILAQFFVILIAYLIIKNSKQSLAYSFLAIAFGVLAKYSLSIYLVASSVLFLKTKHARAFWVYPFVAAIVLFFWIFTNFKITDTVGLSDSNGIQLYNQIIWIGNKAPSEQSQEMKIFRTYVPKEINIHTGYWDMQEYILSKSNRQWKTADTVLGAVARRAIIENPLHYIATTVYIFIKLHGSLPPYWYNLNTFGLPQGPFPLYCDKFGEFQMCSPLIQTGFSVPLWNAYVNSSNWFYTYCFPVLTYGIFFPSLFFGILTKHSTWKTVTILYLIGVLPIAMFVHPDTRYIIPFYPLMIITMSYGMYYARRFAIKRLWPANGRKTGGM